MRPYLLLGSALVLAGGWVPLDRPAGSAERGLYDEGTFACTAASITDGDTVRCEETDVDGKQIRVRLSGIASRERDGSCSPGHPCPAGSAEAATAMLEQLSAGDKLSCAAVGSTYGRVAAFCTNSAGVDLSCAMVDSGTAARWQRYWGEHRC